MEPIKVLSYDDDDLPTQQHIVKFLNSTFFIELANTEEEFFQKLRSKNFDVLLLDKNLGKHSLDGVALLPELKREFPNLAIIILTYDDDYNEVTKSFSLGASDYVVKKTISMISDLNIRIPEAVRRLKKDRFFEIEKAQTQAPSYSLTGSSRYVFELRKTIDTLNNSNESFLITGPHGSGRTSLARTISNHSLDKLKPYVYLDLKTINPYELEEKLFGTSTSKKGAFLLADKGDLVLDGCEYLSNELQNKIAKSIHEKRINILGTSSFNRMELRVIFITKQITDIKSLSLIGALKNNHIQLLPLSERTSDILQIAFEILSEYKVMNIKLKKSVIHFINTYSWPGNLRQLIQSLRLAIQLTVSEGGIEIDLSRMMRAHRSWLFPETKSHASIKVPLPQFIQDISKENLSQCIREAEKHYIQSALTVCENDTLVAAEKLGLSRSGLYTKIVSYDIPTKTLSLNINQARQSILLKKRKLKNDKSI